MPDVKYFTNLTNEQKQTLMSIWNAEYPKQLCMPGLKEFNAFLAQLDNPLYLLLTDDNGAIMGWATIFTATSQRCFFIMLKGAIHGKGYGTLLLNALKERENRLFGWAIDHNKGIKADGTPYPSPINFYIKNGFAVNYTLRLDTEVLSAVNIIWQANATSEN